MKGNSTSLKDPPTLLPVCPFPLVEPGIDHITWTRCRGKGPKVLINDSKSNIQVIDWSPHGDFETKWSKIPLKWHKLNQTLTGEGNKTIVWHDRGLTAPMTHLDRSPAAQGHLWKLLAVGEAINVWTGNMSLNVSNSKNPFTMQLHVNNSRYINACVKFPFVLLAGSITWNAATGGIICPGNCSL